MSKFREVMQEKLEARGFMMSPEDALGICEAFLEANLDYLKENEPQAKNSIRLLKEMLSELPMDFEDDEETEEE